MTHEQFEKTVQYWESKQQTAMPQEALKKAVSDHIAQNNTCALATGTGDYVRCTPIEYSFHDGKFRMFSEGGKKFVGLEKLESPMNLICVTPTEIQALFSDFKKEGYSSRQTLTLGV
mgnify:CR=1 FL=1